MRRLMGIAAGCAVCAFLLMPATTLAAPGAIVARDVITTPFAESGLEGCAPGVTGTFVGTNVLSYQTVETAHGFHVAGTTVDSGRFEWSDGTYAIIDSVDRFAFNTGAGAEVLTNTHVDSVDVYSTEGDVLLFRVTFHLMHRYTTSPDGVTRVDIVKSHEHVFLDTGVC